MSNFSKIMLIYCEILDVHNLPNIISNLIKKKKLVLRNKKQINRIARIVTQKKKHNFHHSFKILQVNANNKTALQNPLKTYYKTHQP
jgi:hypothetical protein